ncbi:bifunctional tetrahydrofolate synthase/dihydrofolate synthase [Bermanella marisrubri]|uniref:Dihydrofolate synthase/folylpolyglutamate synthase n=1 Tax=Bermanella marisrubri TaxID=207949 RepID=Q1N6P7_9GAMM|nr:bifunctional tetrahydrofolate synthase/dihydrofolate synthase [Bermanella marisrubri]EAT13545.1 folylpolyglutamate synthetase [Oceanobacter sp. RED65] [Bermanella marisrubri]QIZ84342.1 bifunctional tetrahydrofolate synthase/dihydrofolate synthase [Bermanella marisrubri]
MSRNLDQWLQYLESAHPKDIDLGLDRVRAVAERLDLIKPAKYVVLVAGTNGKGTTVATCGELFRQSGFSVGVFTSPHITKYNERVSINGKQVSDAQLIDSFEAIESKRGDISLTYFEVSALSALYLFKQANVEAAVLEIGLGGRLDAVNLVDPDVSIVTSIGLDHQDWLGDTLDKIGYEKAGVYRQSKPAICGQVNPPSGLLAHANEIDAKLLIKHQDFHHQLNEQGGFDWFGVNASGERIVFNDLPLPKVPIENACTALQAMMMLPIEWAIEDVRLALQNVFVEGRLQAFCYQGSSGQSVSGMLDVGHNPQAAEFLLQYIPETKGRVFAVLAMLQDKNPNDVVTALKDRVDQWCFAGLQGYRGQTAQELMSRIDHLPHGSRDFHSVSQAMECVMEEVTCDDYVVVLGSFLTVSAAKSWLEQ